MEIEYVKKRLFQILSSVDLEKFMNEWGIYKTSSMNKITKIGYSVSLNPDIVEQAYKHHVNLIVTHHDAWPFLFDLRENTYMLLERYAIHHLFVHGPLDQIEFGTSSALLAKLGAEYCEDFNECNGLFWGKIGELPKAVPFSKFQEYTTKMVGYIPREAIKGKQLVKRIGVVTGGGSMTTDLKAAVEKKCDTYITGEMTLYFLMYAKWVGINTLVYGHNNTEIFGVENLVKQLVLDVSNIDIIKLKDENF